MKEAKPIELDGRTGEGGGQLVRIACALAAVANVPVRITNVRGNREGPRGGGLKSQHVSALSYLAKATSAETAGLAVGSHVLEFRPTLKPSDLEARNITIATDSAAASTLLIFQALLPFLMFASNERGDPIKLQISGGTNVSFSLSYEYLDQVLLPMLEGFFVGIRVERSLTGRGWSQGKITRGTIHFVIHPLKLGEPLRLREPERVFGPDDLEVVDIDVSMVAPADMHEDLTDALVQDLGDLFPGVDVTFKIVEDSGTDSRIYVLLVAKSETLRWGRDILSAVPKKAKAAGGKGAKNGAKASVSTSESIARKVSKELFAEVSSGGVVDEYLQDQLVVFQALAEGRSSFPRTGVAPAEHGTNGHGANGGDANGDGTNGKETGLEQAMEKLDVGNLRKEKADQPFGEGSAHTTTARWVTAELLPKVAWYNEGRICEGVGMCMDKPLRG
ncbi:hypothetical protein OQA88_6242 [Cercophora sp. LCS_1]